VNAQQPFIIPYAGLKSGEHRFSFIADDLFFQSFPDSYLKKGSVKADLVFDKRNNMVTLLFSFKGKVEVECDRCAEPYFQPIKDKREFIIKFTADEVDDDEVVYLPLETSEINVAEYLYESVLLSLPLRCVHPNDGCSPEALRWIMGGSNDEEEKKQENNAENPFSSALKNINLSNNKN
jgi:uncharacterized metal-binding protein YceD (DUF177 family)